MVPFDRPYTIFYWSAVVTIALSCTIFSYLALNDIVTLKSGLEVTEGQWNWCNSKPCMRFLFAYYSNNGTILYRLRDIASYWLKIAKLLYPTCIR